MRPGLRTTRLRAGVTGAQNHPGAQGTTRQTRSVPLGALAFSSISNKANQLWLAHGPTFQTNPKQKKFRLRNQTDRMQPYSRGRW